MHVATPELYGLELAAHFLATYPHIHTVHVDVVKLKWSRRVAVPLGSTLADRRRIPVAGAPHKHSFVRNGDEKRFTRIVMHNKQRALSTTISSGLRDLLVLKTTESSFEGFLRDEYTTLPGQYTAARSGSSATLANPPSRGRRQDLLHLDRLHLPTRAPAPFRLDCDHRGRPRSARCDDRLERDPRIDRHDHVRDVRDTQFGFGAGHALPDGHHDPRHAPRGQQRRVHSPEQGPFDPLPHEHTADELVRFSTTLQST